MGPVADFVMDVAGREDGFAAIAELGFVEAALEAALAVGQLALYLRCHSKSLLDRGDGDWSLLS